MSSSIPPIPPPTAAASPLGLLPRSSSVPQVVHIPVVPLVLLISVISFSMPLVVTALTLPPPTPQLWLQLPHRRPAKAGTYFIPIPHLAYHHVYKISGRDTARTPRTAAL